jgi:hypothetical protein
MQTYTGRAFYPMDPQPEDVDIIDIAHALSLICRFGGHCDRSYTVCEHSLLVADIVAHLEPNDYQAQLWGLMHDSAEAYTGDVIQPIKYSSPEVTAIFKQMEDGCLEAIAEALDLPLPMSPIVKRADDLALSLECRDLMQGERAGPWTVGASRSIPPCLADRNKWHVRSLRPAYAEECFLKEYVELKEQLEAQ